MGRRILTARGTRLVAIVSVVLAAAIVTPALGGPSLSKISKKANRALSEAGEAQETAQQALQKAGTPGPPGTQGQQGPSALRLDFDQPKTDNTLRTVGTQNELAVKVECDPDTDTATARISIHVQSSVAATINFFGSNDSGGSPSLTSGPNNPSLAAGVDKELFALISGAGGFRRIMLELTYRNPSRVITIQAHLRADDASGRCQFQGTAVPAT